MPNERAPPRPSMRPLRIPDDENGSQSADDSLEEITSAIFNASQNLSHATVQPTFGHPAVLGHRKPISKSSIFNEQKHRPEHHKSNRMSYPLNQNTKISTKPTGNPLYTNHGAHRILPPHFSNPNPPYKKPTQIVQPMFGTNDVDAQPIDSQQVPSLSQSDPYPEIYMSAKDTENAIKDLLEGAMDEDEDEDIGNNENPEKKQESNDYISSEGEGPYDKAKMKDGPQPDGSLQGIKVKLLPHQVEGVKWMKQREVGPVKRGKIPKGGVLADDMGLGKTLQSISLIISNQKPEKEEKGYKKHFDNISKTTLVVAPLALIKQWEAEIKDKVSSKHNLRVCVHHGPQRTKSFKELAGYDVVVTTYQILVSEYSHSHNHDGGFKTGCFGVHWWRVILDEAHSIKNRNAKSTKACYALRSEYRWCLTGTPLQNNLDELQSLVSFLRVSPYDNLQEWKKSIIQPLNGNRGHIALRRLHAFLRCIMKRRKKDILKEEGALVPGGKAAMEKAIAEAEKNGTTEPKKPLFKTTARNVKPIVVNFSPAERKYYANLEQRADKSIEKMRKDKINYANALVLLLRLRQACDHPKLVGNKLDKDKDTLGAETQGKSSTNTEIDSLADMLGGLDIRIKQCDICLQELDKVDIASGREMCKACHDDLVYFNRDDFAEKKMERKKLKEQKQLEKEKRRKERRKLRRNVVESDEDVQVLSNNSRCQRPRYAIVDSDDEEEEGSWLVSEGERGPINLGKAGGTDDENAEGGGDTIISDEDETTDEDDGSGLSSFVVKDEDASRGDSIAYSEDDEPLSVADALKQPPKEKRRSCPRTLGPENKFHDSEERSSDAESEVSLEESEMDTTISDSENEDSLLSRDKRDGILASAKIRELVNILSKECHEHKFIVFSQFTSMLNLIEPFLQKHRFGFVRYDGAMRNDQREESLRSLREDKRTRILLCSLKCGSLGLNLTAATRVVILEPFWNPVCNPLAQNNLSPGIINLFFLVIVY